MKVGLLILVVGVVVAIAPPVLSQESDVRNSLDTLASGPLQKTGTVGISNHVQRNETVERKHAVSDPMWKTGLAGLAKGRVSTGGRLIALFIYMLVFVGSSIPVGSLGRDIGTELNALTGTIVVCCIAGLGYVICWGVPMSSLQWILCIANVVGYLFCGLIMSAIAATDW